MQKQRVNSPKKTKELSHGNSLGQFFTDYKVAKMCVLRLAELLYPNDTNKPNDKFKQTHFVEPSAGQGVFIKALDDLGCHKHCSVEVDQELYKKFKLDIYSPFEKGGYIGVSQKDIFKANARVPLHTPAQAQALARVSTHARVPLHTPAPAQALARAQKNKNEYEYDSSKVICIGNPPFSNPRTTGNDRGHYSNLALKFVNHTIEKDIAETVAFVLPSSFRRPLLLKRVHPNLHLVADYSLSEDIPFYQNDPEGLTPVKKNCCFMVWRVLRDPETGNIIKRQDRNTNLFEWLKDSKHAIEKSYSSDEGSNSTKNGRKKSPKRKKTISDCKGYWVDKESGFLGPFQFVDNLDERANLAIYKWGTPKRVGDVLGTQATQDKIAQNLIEYKRNVSEGLKAPRTGGTIYYLFCHDYNKPEVAFTKDQINRIKSVFDSKKEMFAKLALDRSHNKTSVDITRDDCLNIYLS